MVPQERAQPKQPKAAKAQRLETQTRHLDNDLAPQWVNDLQTAMPSPLLSHATLQRALAAPRTLVPNDILQLQRTVGNQAVSRMLNAQAKPTLQRDGEDGNDAGGGIETGAGFEAGGDFERQLSHSKGGGTPLPKKERASFESSFGANFSNVRIHTDAAANQLSRSIQAKAFTHGNDIHFDAGEYNPASSQGKQLLAHELTHTLQQGGDKQAKGVQPKLQVGAAHDRYEQEADHVAASISGHKGGAAGKVQPMAVPSVQRMMKFGPGDLHGGLSKGAKRGAKVGIISAYRKLETELERYHAAKGGDLRIQERLLNNLLNLSDSYLKDHDKPAKKLGGGADPKVQSVIKMRLAITTELTKLRPKIKNAEFLRNFQHGSAYIEDVPMIGPLIDPLGPGMALAKNKRKSASKNKAVSKEPFTNNTHVQVPDNLGGFTPTLSSPENRVDLHNQYKSQKHLGLTPGQRAAVYSYTTNQFEFINPAMDDNPAWTKAMVDKNNKNKKSNNKIKSDDAAITKIMLRNKEIGEVVTSALNTMPPSKQTKTIYRGETITEDVAAAMKVGYVKKHNYFVSTSQGRTVPLDMSLRNRTAERPWSVIYHIISSKTGRDVSSMSKTPHELEILFPVGTAFEVTKVLSKKDYNMEVRVKAI